MRKQLDERVKFPGPQMEHLFRVSGAGGTFHAVQRGGELFRANPTAGSIFDGYTPGEPVTGGLAAVTLLPPVSPSKLVCVGLNYRDHAKEMGKPLPVEPLLFLKPSTAVVGPGEAVMIPPGVGRVDYEGELGIVIGRRARRVAKADAWKYV